MRWLAQADRPRAASIASRSVARTADIEGKSAFVDTVQDRRDFEQRRVPFS